MKKKKAGFTLIEMIIVLMLTVIILGIMGTIFLTGNRVFADTDVKSDLQIEGQTTHETLSNLGMQAVGIKQVDDIDFEKDSDNVKKDPMMNKWTSIKKIVLYVVEVPESMSDKEKKPDSKIGEDKAVTSDKSSEEKVKKNTYTFELKGKELSMIKPGSTSGKILSTNVETFEIRPSNTGLEFQVMLTKKKFFADEKKYPIKVDVLFRNKDAILDSNDTKDDSHT